MVLEGQEELKKKTWRQRNPFLFGFIIVFLIACTIFVITYGFQTNWTFKESFTSNTDVTNNPVEPHPAVSAPQAAPEPTMDYNSMLLTSVADPELIRRQNEWADDVTKYSGGTRIDSDVIDMESTINFQGLRRPEAPPVSPNALFVTEITPAHLSENVGIFF